MLNSIIHFPFKENSQNKGVWGKRMIFFKKASWGHFPTELLIKVLKTLTKVFSFCLSRKNLSIKVDKNKATDYFLSWKSETPSAAIMETLKRGSSALSVCFWTLAAQAVVCLYSRGKLLENAWNRNKSREPVALAAFW